METGTKVYGASDDLIEFEGEFTGEVGHYSDDGNLVLMSDGTVMEVKYGDEGIWKIIVKKVGSLFERLDICDDADATPHSDIAVFAKGIKWAYSASEWEKVH